MRLQVTSQHSTTSDPNFSAADHRRHYAASPPAASQALFLHNRQYSGLLKAKRDAIVTVDPYRKGFDVFKSEQIAAEKAEAVRQDEAAE